MFILICKIFTFDFYHASEIAFFGNTAQRKRTLADLHVSCGRDISRPYDGEHAKRWYGTQNEGVARKTKGWHTKRWGGTQNDGMARKTMVWHAKRWGGTQNDGMARKTMGGTQNEGWHAKRWVAHKTIGVGN